MDSTSVEAIIASLKTLIEQEEAKPKAEQGDVRHLKDALSVLEDKEPAMPVIPSMSSEIVDTDLLTGPINGLKNFLIRKTRNQDAK